MHLSIQFKIKANPIYQRFLRENSYWYKILNRNPEAFDDFVDEMKKKYKLTTTDRISNVLDKIKLFQSFMSMLN